MASAQRGVKHSRPPSAVSRDAKRIRDDDETVVSDMSLDRSSALAPTTTTKTRGVTRKRDERRTTSDDEGTVSESGDAVAEEREEEEESTTELGDERTGEDALDDEAWLRKHGGREVERSGKVARTSNVDSPSKLKRRVKVGARDPFVTSPPGSKARGKRAADESDDHEIGEEWTDLNGLRWRMDDDGNVRREAIVVEKRLKYPNMPKDSRHPDAKVQVPVLVEKFLTEAEYEEMKSKKLLGFQEEERQRDIEEAKEARRRKQEQDEEERRTRMAQSGRPITTPKKIRDVQALYDSPLRRTASPSPLRGVLPTSDSARARSTSDVSFRSAVPSASPSPSVPYKRLSLSMRSTSSAPTTPQAKERSASISAPTNADDRSPQRATNSLRLPLSSPATAQTNTPGSTIRRMLGSLGGIVARRKREESLLNLLRSESEQRKKREASVK